MAFVPVNLAVLSYAAGFTLWNYATVEDTLAAVLSPTYFDPAQARLRRDDWILIAARDGAALAYVGAVTPAGVTLHAIASTASLAPPSAIPTNAILGENGMPILSEDGAFVLAD